MKQKKQQQEMDRPLEFLDCIAPSIIRFQTDHCILGSSYRCYWALKEYPTSTDEQAMTRPLFSIPQHQFIFNAGTVDKSFYMDLLQLEESEFEHIRSPQRGVCLYKCGHERFLLEVDVPKHRAELFGTAGGR